MSVAAGDETRVGIRTRPRPTAIGDRTGGSLDTNPSAIIGSVLARPRTLTPYGGGVPGESSSHAGWECAIHHQPDQRSFDGTGAKGRIDNGLRGVTRNPTKPHLPTIREVESVGRVGSCLVF